MPEDRSPDALSAGTPAPQFELPATGERSIALSDFAGRNVILTFYPGDWTPVCTDQLSLYNELLTVFSRTRRAAARHLRG